VLQRLALALVWLAVASGAVVFSEPAPVDVLTMGLVIGLPLVGLVRPAPALWLAFAAWLVCGAGALVAATQSLDLARSTTHTAISIYLYAAFFTMAGFVSLRPREHTRLILDAYLWAAFIGAVAGIVGYFDLVPGAAVIFTKYERASGTFKDPNVYGPFMVPALLYALHKVLSNRLTRTLVPAVMVVFLSFAILLSFSRGAWFNAAVAVAAFGYFSIMFTATNRQRMKMILLGLAALVIAGGVLAAASKTDAVSDLLSERAALTQTYDVGPEGRFGGQEKAKSIILDNPLGIGALEFATRRHHEDVHNVYLTMMLSAGWIGGLLFLTLVVATVAWGFGHALKDTPTRPLFLIAYAAFVGNALEGCIIDIDHWRHFYLLMAIVWGLMTADRQLAAGADVARTTRRRRRILTMHEARAATA
jgi:O-antigen ligase